VERLRAATGKTWDALAADLGLKRAMVFHVVAGRRGFSERTMQRLLECEVAAGVRSEASAMIEQGVRGDNPMAALLGRGGSAQSEVNIEDIDAGSKAVALEYRRGSPPPNYPTKLTVTSVRNSTVWGIIGGKGASEDPSRFLAACLADLKGKPDLLERLTPPCYARILDIALDLTFGLNWRAKLRPEKNTTKSNPK
jgi:hypothetical protein